MRHICRDGGALPPRPPPLTLQSLLYSAVRENVTHRRKCVKGALSVTDVDRY